MDQKVIDMRKILQNKFFAEDDLPRTGSIHPEFSHTITVCVDAFGCCLAQGCIHNYYFESKTEFSSLDQMLLGIDDILDRAGECQRDTRLRTTFKKEPTMKNTSMSDEQFADYLTSSIVERMPPAFNPDTLRVKEGKLASYFIRVLARQHSSMQGVINRAGKEGVCVFRSEMELLRLIRDDLTAECSWNKRKAGK